MKAFTEPILTMGQYPELKKALSKKGLFTITGCIDQQKPHLIYAAGAKNSHKLVVTFHEQRARELVEELSFYDSSVVYYPAKDVLFYQSDIRGNMLTSERIRALKMLEEEKQVTYCS